MTDAPSATILRITDSWSQSKQIGVPIAPILVLIDFASLPFLPSLKSGTGLFLK
jgi:hypothetical protein